MIDIPLNKRIEATLLKPTATEEEVKQLCDSAKKLNVRAVCVAPLHIQLVAELLKDTEILTVAVVGFPLGNTLPSVKAVEAASVKGSGAKEIDLVPTLNRITKEEISSIIEISRLPLKVILETGLLTTDQIIKGARIAIEAGAFCVKTCTGYGPRGVTIDDIELLKATIGNRALIKASGKINTKEWAEALIKAGADFIGTSSAEKILETI